MFLLSDFLVQIYSIFDFLFQAGFSIETSRFNNLFLYFLFSFLNQGDFTLHFFFFWFFIAWISIFNIFFYAVYILVGMIIIWFWIVMLLYRTWLVLKRWVIGRFWRLFTENGILMINLINILCVRVDIHRMQVLRFKRMINVFIMNERAVNNAIVFYLLVY